MDAIWCRSMDLSARQIPWNLYQNVKLLLQKLTTTFRSYGFLPEKKSGFVLADLTMSIEFTTPALADEVCHEFELSTWLDVVGLTVRASCEWSPVVVSPLCPVTGQLGSNCQLFKSQLRARPALSILDLWQQFHGRERSSPKFCQGKYLTRC